MNKEIKEKWLNALRSGDYVQGRACLRTSNNTFCCLGVLCDLSEKEDIGKWEYDGVFAGSESDYSSVVLPSKVFQWAGLENRNPVINTNGELDGMMTLSELNDKGVSFEEIAEIIEKCC